MNFEEQLNIAREKVVSGKAARFDSVLNAKRNSQSAFENISNADTVNAFEQQALAPDTEAFEQIGQDAIALSPNAPVVETEGAISKHADGTYSVTTAEGRTIPGLSEVDARAFAGFNQENARAIKAGAPTDFFGTKVNAIAQTTIDIGAQAASAFTTDPENLKAIKDFGQNLKTNVPVNRREQVAAHTAFKTIAKNSGNFAAIMNAATNDLGTLISQGFDSIPYMVAFTIGGPIAQAGILTSLAIGKGNQAVEEFTEVNGRRPNQEETTRIKFWSAIGTVAEKYGDMAALKGVPGRLGWFKQVARTVGETTPPSILSLAVFRPIAGLAGEGLSGGITSATEQLAADGKITDTGAIAFDTLAEMAGTPGGLAGVVAGNSVINAGKAAVEAITGPNAEERRVAAEDALVAGAQGLIDSTEPVTVAQTNDGTKMQARIAELDKLIGVLPDGEAPTLVAEREQLIADLQVPLTDEQTIRYKDALGIKLEAVKEQIKLRRTPPPSTAGTTIDDKEFKAAVSGIDLTSPATAINSLIELSKRNITADQHVVLKSTLATLEKAATGLIKAEDKVIEFLGSDGDVRKFTDAELEAVTKRAKTPEDTQYIADVQESAALEEAIKDPTDPRSAKDIQEVAGEVLDGEVSSRYTGLNTYRDEIKKIRDREIKTEQDQAVADSEILTIEQDMQIHADNLAKKAEKFAQAFEIANRENKSVVVRGTQDESIKGSHARAITYRLDEEAEAPKAGEPRQAFTFTIGSFSSQLISTVKSEAAHGTKVLAAVQGYKNTSFAVGAFARMQNIAAAKILRAELSKIKFTEDTKKLTEDEIANTPAPKQQLTPTDELQNEGRYSLLSSLAAAKHDRDTDPDSSVKGKSDIELERIYKEGIDKINNFLKIAKKNKVPTEKI